MTCLLTVVAGWGGDVGAASVRGAYPRRHGRPAGGAAGGEHGGAEGGVPERPRAGRQPRGVHPRRRSATQHTHTDIQQQAIRILKNYYFWISYLWAVYKYNNCIAGEIGNPSVSRQRVY